MGNIDLGNIDLRELSKKRLPILDGKELAATHDEQTVAIMADIKCLCGELMYECHIGAASKEGLKDYIVIGCKVCDRIRLQNRETGEIRWLTPAETQKVGYKEQWEASLKRSSFIEVQRAK